MDAGQVLSVVGDQAFNRQVNLANESPIGIAIDDLPYLGHDLCDLGLVGRVELQQAIDVGLFRSIGRVDWIVSKRRILDQVPEHIYAKTIDAAVEPEPHYRIQGSAHLRIAPVEVGLLLQKSMVVVLLRCLVPCPCTPAEIACPVVRRSAIRFSIPPNVPIPLSV